MHKRPSSEFFFDDAIRCEESDEGLKFMSFKSDLGARKGVTANSFSSVSYTHLTLPTIYSV